MTRPQKSKVPLIGTILTSTIIGSVIFYTMRIMSWKLLLVVMAIEFFVALVIMLPYFFHGNDSGYSKIHKVRYIGVLFAFIIILLLLLAG
jgi:heme/copper-type cytochrome/quinol oxidase subunit 4